MDTMVIIWAVVVAVALVLEFFTYEFISTWFAVGGIAALIMAACGVSVDLQIIVFVVVSLVLLLCLRPIIKKFIKFESIVTNAESNIGKVLKLETNIDDGKGTIKLNGVLWTVVCDDELIAGTKVVITAISGNKYVVKRA